MNPAYFNFGLPMQLVAPPQDAPPQGAGTPKPRPKTPKKITSKDALNSFEKSGQTKEISVAWMISEISTKGFIYANSSSGQSPPIEIYLENYTGEKYTIPVVGDELEGFLNAACNQKCASIVNSVSNYLDVHSTKMIRILYYQNLGKKILSCGLDKNADFQSALEQFDTKMKGMAANYPEFINAEGVQYVLMKNLESLPAVNFQSSALKIIMSPIWNKCTLLLNTTMPVSALADFKFSPKLKLFWGLKHFPDFYKVLLKRLFQINCMLYEDVANIVKDKFIAVAFNAPMQELTMNLDLKRKAMTSAPGQPAGPKRQRLNPK